MNAPITIRARVTQLGPREWRAEVLSGLDPMVLRPAVRARKPNQAIAGLREAIEVDEKRPFVFAFEPDGSPPFKPAKPKAQGRLAPDAVRAMKRAVNHVRKAHVEMRKAQLSALTFVESDVPGEAGPVRVTVRLRAVTAKAPARPPTR